MNAVTKILSKILGKIPARGTIMTPTGTEDYPIAISNEVMGGPFIVDSIEELKEIPIARLLKGSKCTVNEHEDINGKTIPTRTYLLRVVPTTKLSLLDPINISDYWSLDKPQQEEESAIEYQYAPNYEGLKPPFINAVISTDAYNAGYATNADYAAGDTSKIIWESDYDLANHVWVRQRRGSLADWGIPVEINSDYEEGSYNDIRFLWKAKVDGAPARPSSIIDGVPNNEPEGWTDTPEIPGGVAYETYIQTYNLWRINAIKGVYGELKSNWSDPIIVSTNPDLVRYGKDASNQDYLNPTYWRGSYSVGDRYKASRATTNSEWKVEMITGESGEYTDFVFKQFEDSYEPTLDDIPTTNLGYGTDGWRDGTFIPTEGYTLYVSTCRKYSNGERISDWTLPTRFDGKNTTRAIVTPTGTTGTAFKFTTLDGVKSVSPTSISLEAKLFDANKLVDPANYTVDWYVGDIATGVKVAAGVPDAPIMSGTNNTILTITDAHVSGSQIFTARVWLDGEDYIDEITIYDVTDGLGYVPLVTSESGFTYKGPQTKTFTGHMYENGKDISTANGVTYKWYLGIINISNSRTANVEDTSVDGIANLKLEVTVLGETYTIVESLTDVVDGKSYERQYSALEDLVDPNATPDTDNNPNEWSTSALNAVWVIERLEGENWGDPYRIKGEKGDPNGAFQITVYKTYDPLSPPTTEWRYTKPTAKTDPNAGLTPDGWTDEPQSNAPTGSTIYGSKATFVKADTESNDELVKNWIISGTWSTPFKLTYFASDGEGTQGPDGDKGWSPIISGESYNDAKILKVSDWTGGEGIKPSGGYITTTGLSANPANAINIRGAQGIQGPPGEDGIFNADDFWDGAIYRIFGSNGSPDFESWDFRFRKAKNGIVYVIGRTYRNGGGARWRNFSLGANWQTKMKPVTDLAAGVSYETDVIIAGGHARDGVSPEVGSDDYVSNALIIGNTLRIRFTDDWVTQFSGSYPTADAFGL